MIIILRLTVIWLLSLLAGCSVVNRALLSAPSMAPYVHLKANQATENEDLTVRFLGTSTISFSDGSTSIMTDGFSSRPSIRKVLFGQIAPNEKRIDRALEGAEIQRPSAIFVAHSHYDHAMDSAMVAQKKGAVVLGSASTANIMRGSGLPKNRIHVFADGDAFSFGRFCVTVFKTPHSPRPLSPAR